MRCAVVESGEVVNVILAEQPNDFGAIPCSDEVCIGWGYQAGEFVSPAAVVPPPPIPEIISDRQFFQELAIRQVITEDEALAAVATGTIPAAMLALIASLPTSEQFSAKMLIAGATTFYRAHPVASLIGDLYGWDSVQIDGLWRDAALL
ncbi:hypothetical protein MRS76_20305 [Rhizobiaceae bacterium n13]|uniref:hypothetical protein n=1 Tax=Ferirhizobium litorale TaxID=2927786 RepID=UPI0024B2FE6B|nr:hypothetical protein [Fererhizobium litorale]MDI7864285.1 hypothetical protein [Fererhizobium litorale]